MTQIQNRKSGRIYISQGDYAIDGGPEAVISTLLGSCIAVCIWDPRRGIGGMNHVLFVDETKGSSGAYGYGVNAMELLINGLCRLGADRKNLSAKVFGGARMIDGLSDSGARNAGFVNDFLARESIHQTGSDIGGTRARRIEFWPGTGRARVKYVTEVVAVRPTAPHATSDIELF